MSEDSDDTTEEAAYHLMLEMLQNVCDRAWQIPETSLLQTLYEWGLKQLKNS